MVVVHKTLKLNYPEYSRTRSDNPDCAVPVPPQVSPVRLGAVDECAGMAAFLTSAAAIFVTGQTIIQDGGPPV